MNTNKNLIITAIIIFLTGQTLADFGFTEKQSIETYGKPKGILQRQNEKILLFETPEASIIETFNDAGICIQSSKKDKPPKYSAQRPAYTQQAPTTIYIQQPKPPQRPNPYTITQQPIRPTATPENSALINLVNIIESVNTTAAVFVIVSMCLAIAYYIITRKKPTTAENEEKPTSREQIEGLFEYIKRKNDDPLGTKIKKEEG